MLIGSTSVNVTGPPTKGSADPSRESADELLSGHSSFLEELEESSEHAESPKTISSNKQ
jgi:hypothetical protein